MDRQAQRVFFLTPATSREKNGSHRSKKQTGVSFLGIHSKRSIEDVEAMAEVVTTACGIAKKKNLEQKLQCSTACSGTAARK